MSKKLFEEAVRSAEKKFDNLPKFLFRKAGTNEILVFHSKYNKLTAFQVNLKYHEPFFFTKSRGLKT